MSPPVTAATDAAAMHYVIVALLLLLGVAVSNIVARLLPVRLPLPLIQIAVGALLSGPFDFRVRMDPDIFFLLFIPPLLFLDGWRIPKGAFFHDLRPILTLAVGLVIFTVVGMGIFIHWLLPSLPLPVAFALAAVLAPTDTVALRAVRGGVPLPSRLRHILEGEALLNDASGLDIFRYSVAAMMAGGFSLSKTALGFLWMVGAGVTLGVGVAFACGYTLRWLGRLGGEDTGVQILVSLLVPFAAYLAAEHLGASGILAAASAGIATHYVNLHGPELSATRVERDAVWKTLQGVLNGIIFVLLGDQLVRIFGVDLSDARLFAMAGDWTLLLYVLAVSCTLLLLRFVWVWASLHLSRRWLWKGRPVPEAREQRLLVTIATIAGVRGAVTLAGILSLPLLLPGGGGFPGRELVVVIAMGVVLVSLLLASSALPLLVRRLPVEASSEDIFEEQGARQSAARAAVERLEAMRNEVVTPGSEGQIASEALDFLLDTYRRRLREESGGGERVWVVEQTEREFHLEALAAERNQLFRLRFEQRIDDDLHQKLVLEVDLLEASLRAKD